MQLFNMCYFPYSLIGDGDATTSPRHPVLLNRNIYPAPASHLSLEESTKFRFILCIHHVFNKN